MNSIRANITAMLAHAVVIVGPWAASMSSGCSTTDTVVAVNVASSKAVGQVDKLRVTITQSGRSPLAKEFTPPSEETDSGPSIKPSFYERITLPDDWEHAQARVEVEALNENGAVFLAADTQVLIRPQGAVAAFVMLGKAETPAADAGTEDDAGGAKADAGD